MKDNFINYNVQFQQFNIQFLENIKNAENTKTYDEINEDFKIHNNEISDMFIKHDMGVKDMKPCLSTLERIHRENSNLLEPIENLTDEVTYILYY